MVSDFNFIKDFDWNKLKIFVQVVDSRSINAAAIVLNRKQSSVSRAVKTLELQLGFPLFIRSYNGIEGLTPGGKGIYDYAKKAAVDLRRLQQLGYEAHHGAKGVLTLGVQIFLGFAWLPHHFEEFQEKYPDIKLDVRLGHREQLDSMIPEVDAIIRPGEAANKDLIQQKIFSGKFIICATEQYIAKHGIPTDLDDLGNHRLIVYTDMLLKLGSSPEIQRIPSIQVDNSQLLLASVLNNSGIALLPHYVVRQHPQLVQILKEVELPSYDMYFYFPPEFKDFKKLTLFRQYIAEKIKELK